MTIFIVIFEFDDDSVNRFDSHIFEFESTAKEFAKVGLKLPFVKQVIFKTIEL